VPVCKGLRKVTISEMIPAGMTQIKKKVKVDIPTGLIYFISIESTEQKYE